MNDMYRETYIFLFTGITLKKVRLYKFPYYGQSDGHEEENNKYIWRKQLNEFLYLMKQFSITKIEDRVSLINNMILMLEEV